MTKFGRKLFGVQWQTCMVQGHLSLVLTLGSTKLRTCVNLIKGGEKRDAVKRFSRSSEPAETLKFDLTPMVTWDLS